MRYKLFVLTASLFLIFCSNVFTQTHISVSVEDKIYYILEQAALRGLCPPLSGIRPYTRNTVLAIIDEILSLPNSTKLNETEYAVLLEYHDKFSSKKNGIDFQRGIYYSETLLGNTGIPLTLNIGASLQLEGSSGFFNSSQNNIFGTEIWFGIFLNGDIGSNVSWQFEGEGGLMKVPRKKLGTYYPYYETFTEKGLNNQINIFSEPLTHFPFSYKKRWDASIHPFIDLASFNSWPDTVSGAYNLQSELSSSFLENRLFFRLGRLSHEWGSTPYGSSLSLNQMARPFLAVEGEFKPVSWLTFSSMTGFLEFYNSKGEKESGMTFQNAYSISMMQLSYKNYLFLDLGGTAVWPKRFELGYISPLTTTIFYKNNVGDFDNLGAILNIKAQYPEIGGIWFSLFWDEAYWVKEWNDLDRTMIAWQTGANLTLPIFSFSSVRLSYTRINPYCYTHTRVATPWHRAPMETSYTNNGVSLGYYLPPNSDELLVKFYTIPVKNITANFQFQLIRHGADFGPSAVDGSNLLSELDPEGRDGSNPVLLRFFLKDGAYQWFYIFKTGIEWKIPSLPVVLFGEAGINHSYFTNIDEQANITGTAHPYSKIDEYPYLKSSAFIFKIGVKLFSR
jgi:hypothetical protein